MSGAGAVVLPVIRKHRPPAPDGWIRTPAAGLTLDFHHVLPYATLRSLWNTLVTGWNASRHPEARNALYQYLRLCGMNKPAADRWVTAIRAGKLSIAESDMLAIHAVWPPWNIVEGPKNRADNPDDRLDRFTHGLTRKEFQRMRCIEGLYAEFSNFNDATATPSFASLRAVAGLARLARPVLAGAATCVPFRPGMWEQRQDGKWRKRRSGEQFIAG